jgi:hypothetical protein
VKKEKDRTKRKERGKREERESERERGELAKENIERGGQRGGGHRGALEAGSWDIKGKRSQKGEGRKWEEKWGGGSDRGEERGEKYGRWADGEKTDRNGK